MQPPCCPYQGNAQAIRASRGVHNKIIRLNMSVDNKFNLVCPAINLLSEDDIRVGRKQ